MDTGERKGRPNPREHANPLSALFFCWTVPLFREGFKSDLEMEHLYDTRQKDRSHVLGDRLEKAWRNQEKKLKGTGKKPSLRSALVTTFGPEYAWLGLLTFTSDIVGRLAQPQLLGRLLTAITTGNSSTGVMVGYACGIVGVSAVQAICNSHYILSAFHVGMRVRAACCSLLYRKALRLSQTALGDTAAGQVVNLLSNDVSRFDYVSVFLHYMWAAPVVAIGSGYFMYDEIGWPSLVGIAAVLFVVPLQAYTGRMLAHFRKRVASLTDVRVRFMDEIVSGIRVIKMYAWEKPFTELVRLARRREIRVVRLASYCRGFFMTVILSITRIGLFCALITLALTDKPLQSSQVFVVLTYFNVLSNVVCLMFIRGVAEVAEALVSVRRLETFLHHDEWEPANFIAEIPQKTALNGSASVVEKQPLSDAAEKPPLDGAPDDPAPLESDGPVIELKNVTARWDPASSEPTLSNMDLSVRTGELLAVVGQVGAGKSSLLHAFLGELTSTEGTAWLRGRVSYAAQEPWVFAASVRQNIIFGRPFDAQRYHEVVRACALQRDFQQFPHGDLTVVGQRGASLSGGQKARINLARAVYNDADVYLLDDPLSAVDTHVGKHLFDECVNGFLRGKTRVLVTHQLQYLADADRILLLDNGRTAMMGDFRSLAAMVEYKDLLGTPDDELEELPTEATETENGKPKVAQLLRRISSTRSRASQKSAKKEKRDSALEAEKAAAEMAELSSKYRVQGKSPYLEYFRSGTNPVLLLVLLLFFFIAQGLISGCDWFVSYWAKQEEKRTYYNSLTTEASRVFNHTYNHFLEGTLSDIKPPVENDILDINTYVYIYTGLVVGLLIFAMVRSFGFYTLTTYCSESLHNRMFDAVLRTRVRFFDINPSGRILNRFSKDTGTMDEMLPLTMLDSSQIILQVVGSIVVAATVSPIFLAPVAVLAVVFWFDRIAYLRTSQDIKRLEGIAKSPVFNHLHATLQGLTTVRAYGAQDILMAEFDKHQDLHSSAWYMFITTANAFGFSLDFMVLIYIALITFYVIFFEDAGSDAGLAITQAMSLTGMLQWGVRQSTEVANNIMAVERVLEYSCLEEEPKLEHPPAPEAPKGWPKEGDLTFDHLELSYSAHDPPVLKDLCLHIEAGEKVGIVGRTGAGKSTLLVALFRLAWRIDGKLMIDGVDTADVNLQELRARISVIPQDPVLFSGTMRRNLDPFNDYDDDALYRALDEVELKDALEHGLDSRVAEGGTNYSVGQRQLVCLARALVRNNKVLVLDEATANVDPQTDALIQRTIRTKFRQCTVLTVAHRLNTIMDSDKVLVMGGGKMVEFDHPHLLLKNPNGSFTSLVQETGRNMAETLARVAEESYNDKFGVRM